MYYRLLFGILLFPLLTHPTENENSKTTSAKKDTAVVLKPLGSKSKVLPDITFKPYRLKKKITSSTAEFKIRLNASQTPYKVSLIGININTWLENPQIFKTLEKIGQSFPIRDLLDNLQSYNPELEFNDPETVQQVINTDIYTPYVQVFETKAKIPALFSDIKEVVTYSYPYNIYGVTAGNLPYFGRPMEGGKKEINLGILKGQLSETIAKFPDTDIFLVATVNIIPNWLNETSDILQINQQEMEILIFAFDRKEKLIGGSGVAENFIHQDQFFAIEQKVRSKIWQPIKAREFYILPSTRIVNSTKSGSEISRDVTLPVEQNPRLSILQQYVLSAIKQRQIENLPLEVELFGPKKEKLLPIKRRLPKTQEAQLADKILVHKDSTLLVRNNISNSYPMLSYQEILVRLEDHSKSKSEKNKPIKTYPPTNEEEKLLSLISDGIKSLSTEPITYSNQNSFTNIVVPFELATDPIIYRKKRKQYFSLPQSIKLKQKEFNKDTKKLILTAKRTQKERVFWNTRLKEVLKENNMLSPEICTAFEQWMTAYHKKNTLEIEQIKLMRYGDFPEEIQKYFTLFADRNKTELKNKYISKTQILSNKLSLFELKEKQIQTQIECSVKTEKFTTKQTFVSEEYKTASENEKIAYTAFSQLIPKKIDYINILNKDSISDSTATQIKQKKEQYSNFIKETTQKQNISEELVILALMQKKYSPEYRYQKNMQRKKEQTAWKHSRFLYFEGFMLGLTSGWKTKSRLLDRMIYL